MTKDVILLPLLTSSKRYRESFEVTAQCKSIMNLGLARIVVGNLALSHSYIFSLVTRLVTYYVGVEIKVHRSSLIGQ